MQWGCPYKGKCKELILLPSHFCFWLYAVKKEINWEQLEKMKCGSFLIQINICVAFCRGCKQRTDKQKVNSSVTQPWGDDKKEKDQRGKLKEISQMFIDKQMLFSIQNNFWWNHNLEKKKEKKRNDDCQHSKHL